MPVTIYWHFREKDRSYELGEDEIDIDKSLDNLRQLIEEKQADQGRADVQVRVILRVDVAVVSAEARGVAPNTAEIVPYVYDPDQWVYRIPPEEKRPS